jgi:hypothetical protein
MFKKTGSIKAVVLFLFLFLSLLLPFLTAVAQEKPAPPAQTPVQSAPRRPPAVNVITETAVKAGVLACTSRINQVANFLTAGSQEAGAFLFTPPADPDRRIFSVSLEIPAADGPLAYASGTFAPNQANGCGGMYETIVYWPQKCDDVAVNQFSGLKRGRPLAKTISILDAGTGTKIFLMPAGEGCISIKKEIVQ